MARAHWGALVAAATLLLPILPACSRTAEISSVYTALDADGLRRRNLFYTDTKEIHCVVEYGLSRTGATLEVFIRQLQARDQAKEIEQVNRVLVAVESAPSGGGGTGTQKADVTFQGIGLDGEPDGELPIPSGYYQCEAYLDGEFGGSANFAVDFAPCPAATILPSSGCAGFYENNRSCKRYGATAGDPDTCTCTQGRWECQ